MVEIDNKHIHIYIKESVRLSALYFQKVLTNFILRLMEYGQIVYILGDPEVNANILCKSRKLPNKDKQNYSTDLR